MSSTKRGGKRNESDSYPTPGWVTRVLLREVAAGRSRVRPEGLWLEPAAGDGGIVRVGQRVMPKILWQAVELRHECFEPGRLGRWCRNIVCADFLTLDFADHFDVAITNPPFSLAEQFLDHMRQVSRYVVLLLRFGFLESAKRHARLSVDMPIEVWVLPQRPAFVGTTTDSASYAWYVWGPERTRSSVLRLLPLVSMEDRRDV